MVCARCSMPALVLPVLISNGVVPRRVKPTESTTADDVETSILPLRPKRGDQMSSSTPRVDVMARRERAVSSARGSERKASACTSRRRARQIDSEKEGQ